MTGVLVGGGMNLAVAAAKAMSRVGTGGSEMVVRAMDEIDRMAPLMIGPARSANYGHRTVFTLERMASGGCLTARDGTPHQHARQTARYARRMQKGAGA